jgi:xanthine/uracil permease
VLAAASTILFGVIAMSGVQMLADVEWDDLNMAVAAPSFIISLGLLFLPEELIADLPPAAAAIVTNPMMVGIFMLIVLHILINVILRPLVDQRRQADQPADMEKLVDDGLAAT